MKLRKEEIESLLYRVKSDKIYFTNSYGKTSYMYTKHGIGFTNNLVQLLEDLEKGRIAGLWFNLGLGAKIEIFLNANSEMEGIYSTLNQNLLDTFRKNLKTYSSKK